MNVTKQIRREGTTIYCGASLFSGRETLFNAYLTHNLEIKGYDVIMPQRDGFEFSDLNKSLSSLLRKDEVDTAVQNVIFILDVGKFVPKSNVILANFDEPIDEGLVVEVCSGAALEKTVVGFRTDSRSPFGSPADFFGGMHFFPAMMCDSFIRQHMPNKTLTPDGRCTEDAANAMGELANKIDKVIVADLERRQEDIRQYEKGKNHGWPTLIEELDIFMPRPTRYQAKVTELADVLFKGVDDIHSEAGLRTISKRYAEHKAEMEAIRPS
ncbi:Uncharacterised protein [uncultured archaeon]|nr:Uncharacterised protein [uncultured archaeon]